MGGILFGYSYDKGSIGDQFRAKRFKHFESFLNSLQKPIRILDVGGTEYFWVHRDFHKSTDIKVTLLNLEKVEVEHDMFESVSGDASDLSQYKDNEFDIVFSNSVIEHLYTWEKQVKMANECMRVGRFHYIQTPNKYFFIEPHFRLPFFDLLPKKLAFWLLVNTPLSHGHRWKHEMASTWLEEIKLLTLRQMKELFSTSSVHREKFLGMTKSFTAHNFIE